MGSLGRLHAAWWEDPRLGVTVGTRLDDAAMDSFIGQVEGHFSVFADRLGDELSGEPHAFYAARCSREHRGCTHGIATRGTHADAHGDAHVWNCFLPREPAGRAVDRLGWLAHSRADQRSGLHDEKVSGTRRRQERTLLDHYHAVLPENGVHGYSRADIQEDDRLSVLWHTTTPVFQAGLKLPPVIWWNNFQRVMAAVDDLGCRELLD